MKKILLSAPYMLIDTDRFKGFFAEHNLDVTYANVVERMGEDELFDIIASYDGSICGDDPYTRRVLSKACNLKVISKWGTGIDSIDLQAAKEFGIKVCNTPNAFSHPVADTVLAYILAFARNVVSTTASMKNGIWSKTPCFALSERTLGIIGLGNIGTQVARRASAFGMNIIANDIKPIQPILLEQYGVEMVTKHDIYSNSDFISVHCDLNESSYHVLDYDAFDAMKKKPYIINTARGGHIKHEALLFALENGLIGGVGLDVFAIEPIPQNDPLLGFDNVLLAPHNSNSSPKYWNLVHENTLRSLIENLH